jgi:hypothetical protein
MDLQLSVSTSAQLLSDFADHMRAFLKSENDLNSYQVFVAESGKQYHALHIECLVNMEMNIDAFQMLRERITLLLLSMRMRIKFSFRKKDSVIIIES